MTPTPSETSLQHDMTSSSTGYCRRTFLRWGLSLTAGVPFTVAAARNVLAEAAAPALSSVVPAAGGGAHGRVAIVPCVSYGNELDSALRKSFDLLGGIGSLVKEKTVTVKVNLTGTSFRPFLDRPVGETFMTHFATARALAAAAVTLSMKNQFGLTPNSLYGSEAVSEEATVGRGPLHGAIGSARNLPGFKPGANSPDGSLVARVIVDICAARPIHLAIIDGITAMSGGETPWSGRQQLTKPGILIAGFNPVSTDAVGTAAMGYSDPRAKRGTRPFKNCDNHLLLAEQAGLGTADLGKIEVLGLPLEKARYAYPDF